MYVKNLIFAILLCIVPTLIKAQTYVYSYADPCTGIVKTINVPTNGVTVTYFGQMNTFSPGDFTNGNFNNWANGVYSSFGGNNPCGSTIGISTSVSMAQNTAMNVLGIMNTLDALSSISGGGMNTNGVTESSKTESKSSKKNNKKNNSDGSTGGTTGGTTTGSTTGGETTGTTGGSTTGSTTGGSTTGGSTTGSTTGGSTAGGSTTGGTTTGGSTTGSTTGGSTAGGSTAGGSTTGGTTGGGTTGGSTAGGSTTGGSTTGGTTGGGTTGGGTTGGETTGGSTTGGSTTGGSGGSTTGGSTAGGSTTGGSTAGGTTTGGSTAGGTTTGGSTAGGTTTGGTTGGGSTTGGSTTGGSTTGGSTTGGTTGGETTGGSTAGGSTTGGSTTGDGSTTGSTAGGTGTNGSGTGNSNPNGNSGSDAATTEEKKSTNILGGSVGSIQNSTEGGNGSPTKGNAPTIVLSSDFAGFNFKSGDATYGGKGTAGWTSLNWSGTKSHGFMLDYTSANRGPNLTAFYASIKKRRIDLISVTGTTSFYGKGSLYGTIAIGQMFSFPKVKNLKAIYMATSSLGNVYGTKFIGTAFIAGGMYDFKVGKRTQIKLTNLFIYAPYISYYNDMVLKSPYVIMPIIGTNIGVTKKFKLNVNFGGTYALGENVLNFTVMMGTRFAL